MYFVKYLGSTLTRCFTMFCLASGNVEQSRIILMTAMFMPMCQLLSCRDVDLQRPLAHRMRAMQ